MIAILMMCYIFYVIFGCFTRILKFLCYKNIETNNKNDSFGEGYTWKNHLLVYPQWNWTTNYKIHFFVDIFVFVFCENSIEIITFLFLRKWIHLGELFGRSKKQTKYVSNILHIEPDSIFSLIHLSRGQKKSLAQDWKMCDTRQQPTAVLWPPAPVARDAVDACRPIYELTPHFRSVLRSTPAPTNCVFDTRKNISHKFQLAIFSCWKPLIHNNYKVSKVKPWSKLYTKIVVYDVMQPQRKLFWIV